MSKFEYPVLTAEEQYIKLEEKGLIIDVDTNYVISFLNHHSYFQLMMYFKNYWYRNESGDKVFKSGTKISTIIDDYNFDHELRILLFSQIIHIENSFKNIFCQFSCQKYGNIWRTNKDLFKNEKIFNETINPILLDIDKGEIKNDFIKKYVNNGFDPKYPPFRNMLEVFSFGQIAKMYTYFPDNIVKKQVSKFYDGMDDERFENWIKIIVDVRNITCHHNKLLDRTLKIARVKKIDELLAGKYETVYNLCSAIYYLLTIIKPDNDYKDRVIELIKKYHIVNHGFPGNINELWN